MTDVVAVPGERMEMVLEQFVYICISIYVYAITLKSMSVEFGRSDQNVLELDVMFAQLCECTKNH